MKGSYIMKLENLLNVVSGGTFIEIYVNNEQRFYGKLSDNGSDNVKQWLNREIIRVNVKENGKEVILTIAC